MKNEILEDVAQRYSGDPYLEIFKVELDGTLSNLI